MPFNSIISRTNAAAEIPEEVSRDLINRTADDSAAMQMFRRVPVNRGQTRMPVLSALPVAYFVTGDTGLKQTTQLAWANKFLNVEEIATIVPIPDNVVADMDSNVWDDSMPYLVEAVGRALDAAVFFGSNAPASWPTNISAAAAAAGNSTTEGALAAAGGFMGDVDATIGTLETDGFDPTGYVAARSARGRFRTARNTQGDRVDGGRLNGSLNELDGLPVAYPMRGLFPSGGAAGTNVRLFVGDWDQFVLGVRQDITLKVSQDAVIQDSTGAIIYNSFQQDMTFLRLTFRVGWQVANLINNDQAVEANRYPAARLVF